MYSVLFPILTACLPLLASAVRKRYPALRLHDAPWWLPVVAGALFAGSFYIPDIHISTQTDTFQMHLVGGGLYSAVLFIYFRHLLGWKLNATASWIALFAWTSSLGVANELLEFALHQLGITTMPLTDTSWDLVANTTGALAGYGIYLLIRRLLRS